MMFNLMVLGTPLHSNLGLWGSFGFGLFFQTEQYGCVKAWTAQASTKKTSVLKAWNFAISTSRLFPVSTIKAVNSLP